MKGPAPGSESTPLPVQLLAEVDRLAARSLWPNFDPRALPISIADGQQTWLFRHPDPPAEFLSSGADQETFIFYGLHPAVRANSMVILNGHATATVLLNDTAPRSLTDLATLVIHELFHVFQRRRHPDWTANEAGLFVYPVDDPALLALRRLETAALRRALQAVDRAERGGWAETAMSQRRERFQRLPPEAVAYERGNELQEGLARYVDGKAREDHDHLAGLDRDFPPDGVRERTYAVGRTLALLLDALAPGWQADLENGATRPLDLLLTAALDGGATSAEFTSEERNQAMAQAAADIAALRQERAGHRAAFFAQPGWHVVVRPALGAPLKPRGFDPSNVRHLGRGEVLHTRWLQLGNATGSLEVLGRQALTEAAGSHPLFTGVRTVTVTGLTEQPAVRTTGDGTTVTAPGITATFQHARVEIQQSGVLIQV